MLSRLQILSPLQSSSYQLSSLPVTKWLPCFQASHTDMTVKGTFCLMCFFWFSYWEKLLPESLFPQPISLASFCQNCVTSSHPNQWPAQMWDHQHWPWIQPLFTVGAEIRKHEGFGGGAQVWQTCSKTQIQFGSAGGGHAQDGHRGVALHVEELAFLPPVILGHLRLICRNHLETKIFKLKSFFSLHCFPLCIF